MKSFPLSQTDAYKLSHPKFMDPNTEYTYVNMTCRSHKYLPVMKEFYDETVVIWGLQIFFKDFLIDCWNSEFFLQPKEKVIKRFKRRCDTFLGKDAINMKKFEDLHDLGYLPIKIKAIREGTRLNIKVPFLTMINTDTRFAWLPTFLETVMSCEIWKPITTATITHEFRKMFDKIAMETVGNTNHVMFQGHGFEFRGMSGRFDAAVAGTGTLLNFHGTDTVPSIDVIEDYYGGNAEIELIAASVPASEHSVTSGAIALVGELEFFRKSITESYPTGIVSLVSDTEDYWKVITEFSVALKDDILARKPNELGLAKVVFRPDSGNPIHIVCGDPNAPVESPEYKGSIECLWDVFGGTISEKGYKMLNERVGLIYGDSITQAMAFEILTKLKEKGFASNNIVFGIGSFTMNYLTRDCLGMAVKATWNLVNGKGINIFKAPKTDDGLKKSAKGLLRVDRIENNYILKDEATLEEEAGGELITVFENSQMVREYTYAEVLAILEDHKE